jgi:nonsense-mediated mRNA decay protein 3
VILYLEQIILKHRAHEKAVSIKEMPDGIDFFFKSKSDASMLVDFITGIVMSRSKSSKRLISHSEQNNEYNYKFTFSLTLPPVNRYDLIYLPKKVATALGGISHLQLCVKVILSCLFKKF